MAFGIHQVTRQTALAAASAFQEATQSRLDPAAFVFISAAEAGWTQDPPLCPPFLSEYLVAKVCVGSLSLETISACLNAPAMVFGYSCGFLSQDHASSVLSSCVFLKCCCEPTQHG